MSAELKTPRRRYHAVIDEHQGLLSLDEALVQAAHGGILHYDADRGFDLWSPHRKQSIKVRRTLRKHQNEVLARMNAADALTCPTALHVAYWQRAGDDRMICQKCKHFVEYGLA